MTSNPFKPAENVIVYSDSTFSTLGLDFDPTADYAGCRICGAVYQSQLDRDVRRYLNEGLLKIYEDPYTKEVYFWGLDQCRQAWEDAYDKRQRWRVLHARRYHKPEEVERFTKTGFALTPEAAHKLAPVGFAPLGNMHQDIVDAMLEAPRAPTGDEIEDD